MIQSKSLSVLLCILIISSCAEESHGPLTADDVAPGIVTGVVVENLPGGAKITFELPNDKDILMMEATFKREDGSAATSRTSPYHNFVIIEGLRIQSTQDVELVVVDRSDNRSEVVNVSINPLESPIDQLFRSAELVADFGGVRLNYLNEFDARAEVLLYTKSDEGWEYNQSAFITDGQFTFHTYRTFDPTETDFGISIIDRFNNITEVKEFTLTPLFEEEISKNTWTDPGLLTGDEGPAFGWVKPRLWDDVISDGNGHLTSKAADGFIVPPYTSEFHMFTLDLGIVAKLSRFKFWQRQRSPWIWANGNPRVFDLWGAIEVPKDNGASMEVGWVKLFEDEEVIKPSGEPIGTNTAEDIALARKGHEFSLPLDAPPVRYIRFVQKSNWLGSQFVHISEMSFWGQIQQKQDSLLTP